ncbi:hypothetical protein ACIBG7_18725 [Nonomuraea sp. NPDC050328]|uniref:hypothetical protein n=1 Tax=Nonomuraea sp. NPDC050328 TaxID=3364361 RepID=UPI00379A66B2
MTYVINLWDLIHAPDVPKDVVQRFLTRQRARTTGRTIPDIPAEDLPHLERHAREAPP